MPKNINKKLPSVLLVALFVTGCSTVKPTPLTPQDLRQLSVETRESVFAEIEPLPDVLTLDEAIARALKYNLDRRAKMMEEAISFKTLDVTHYDMLPKLVASAGYTWRDNDKISQSINAESGEQSPSQFISQERSHTTSSLGLTWSMLDLGVGYYATRQQANRVLIATEKRRKAMHLLTQDVRTAYWRAVSAQQLVGEVQATIRKAESALADSRKITVDRLRDPIEALRYQRQLLENLRLLEAISQELSSAQIELASLINAPLGQPLRLQEPTGAIDRGALDVPVERLEEVAMAANPDLREQILNVRIAREETRRTLVRLFPNITFNYAANYDTDKYLVNNSWRDAGVQLSFNLFNLLTGSDQMKLAEAGVALADQRRMASQMAVTAQVHLARQQYANALQQLDRANDIWEIDRSIAEVSASRSQVALQGGLELVANQTSSILSQLRRYQAFAQAQAAEARLQSTVGAEAQIGSVDELSLDELTEALKQRHSVWRTMAEAGR